MIHKKGYSRQLRKKHFKKKKKISNQVLLAEFDGKMYLSIERIPMDRSKFAYLAGIRRAANGMLDQNSVLLSLGIRRADHGDDKLKRI